MSRIYLGERDADGTSVVVVESKSGAIRALNPRFSLRNHSPTGFEWGYGGSGPAQLALAILVDYFSHNPSEIREAACGTRIDVDAEAHCLGISRADVLALALYQKFKAHVVAGLPRDGFRISEDTVTEALTRICRPEGDA